MDLKHIATAEITHTTEKYSLGEHAVLSITTSKPEGGTVVALSGEHPSLPEGCQPAIATPDFFELVKYKNPFDGRWSDFWLESDDLLKVDWSALEPWRLIWVYYNGHEVFDSAGQIVPLIKRYDYIASPFSNEHCRLKDLVSYLKTHPWTVNPKMIEIQRIPSYNASEGRDKYISVSLRPDQDTYNKMYLKAQTGPYWSVRLKEMICGYNILFGGDGEDYLGIRPYLRKQNGGH